MQPILIGKFGKTHGLLGCIRLYSYAQPSEQIFRYQLTDNNNYPIKLLNPKDSGSYFLVKLPSINTINQANAFVNRELYVTPEQLPKTNQDEFYWHELIGCEVINSDNCVFGKVVKILNFGAQDILSIKNQENKETLIPFTQTHIKSIDTSQKQIIAQWISTP